MKRLFINLKTNVKTTGTLLEVRSDSTISAALEKIVSGMEGLEKTGQHVNSPDFRLVRLGSPSRVLENDRTFSNAHTRNGDVFLLIKSADSSTYDGQFSFDPLLYAPVEVSVQDLRAPLRSPLDDNPDGPSTTSDIPPDQSSHQDTIGPGDTDIPSAENEPEKSIFEFEQLDIPLPGGNKMDQTSSPNINPSVQTSAHQKKKQKK